jgi:ATP-dependent Clp protease ATP-binding subunit ClpA
MTTNVGAQVATTNTLGFGKANNSVKNDIINEIKKFFPADLLNRIDEVVAFNPLNEKEIKLIITKELAGFEKELADKNIKIAFSEEVNSFIFNKIQFNNFGARQVIKTIQRELQTLIAEKMLENSKISNIEISIKDNNICVI